MDFRWRTSGPSLRAGHLARVRKDTPGEAQAAATCTCTATDEDGDEATQTVSVTVVVAG